MPRAFLIKKKQSSMANGWPISPKLYSPSSSGIASPTSSSTSSSSSLSPRNDENENVPYRSSSPKYTFDSQCLDLSMKSLLKEANQMPEKSVKSEVYSSMYQPTSFASSYQYPSKFAKIADFLRARENAKTSPQVSPSPLTELKNKSTNVVPTPQTPSSVTTIPQTFSPINESVQCHRLPPYSINWSEHFSVNKLSIVSPTPSSHGSDDSGRGSEQSDDMIVDKCCQSPKNGTKTNGTNKSDRYQCPDCNKSYSTQSGLAKHQEFHCTSQIKKSFSCKHCEKVYVSLGALKMHIRTHTLPCKCKLCGKAFSRPWLLQGHIRTHTGEKPFACQYCNRAFADRSNLRAHLQTHSMVKKYNCKTCSRTFSRMSLLLKHEDNGCCSRATSNPTIQQSEPMALKIES